MSYPMIPFAILCGLVLAGVALSLFAMYRSKAMVRAAEQRVAAERRQSLENVGELQRSVESMSAQLLDLRREPVPTFPMAVQPKAGLNLSKRSQALRMHRRGDAPEQIAEALDVPSQEVDLLVKVHRIVMSTV